jgi:hypothetical protein
VRTSGVLDLYALRCAVAVLVHARHHVLELDDHHIARVDTAIKHVIDVAGDLNGELAAATGWLLSTDADPGGHRTLRAIDRLASLTHVDVTVAPALAASLRDAGSPVQGTLFDPARTPAELREEPA